MPFQKGNPYGGKRTNAGRKTNQEKEEFARLLDCAVTYEERVEIFRNLRDRAIGGDVGACKLLFGYLYGTPVQRVRDERGGAVIQVIRMEAVMPEDARS